AAGLLSPLSLHDALPILLKLDVPGVDVATIDITLDQGVLSVSGERSKEILAQEVERSRIERPHGRFHRRFTLPDTVDASAVSATDRKSTRLNSSHVKISY